MKTKNFFWKNAMIALVFAISLGMVSAKAAVQLPEAMEATELRFSEFKCNVKDFHRNILFTAQNDYLKYFFYHNGISVRLMDELPAEASSTLKPIAALAKAHVLNLNWENANSNMEIVGAEEFKMRKNSKTSKDCQEKQYRKLYFNQLYPGIDLMYADRADQLEIDFQVAAGFNYQDIQFNLEGAEELKIDPAGRLLVSTSNGDLIIDKPLAQQEGKPVAASWVINGQHIGLRIMRSDESKALLIRTHLIQKNQNI